MDQGFGLDKLITRQSFQKWTATSPERRHTSAQKPLEFLHDTVISVPLERHDQVRTHASKPSPLHKFGFCAHRRVGDIDFLSLPVNCSAYHFCFWPRYFPPTLVKRLAQ